jgi:hypothetical protein
MLTATINIWFDIEDYVGLYSINFNGDIKSWKNDIILKPDISRGYKRVTLSKNGKTKRYLVHRLVALTFIDNHNKKKYVNHIDGNKLNNCVKNLEWVTASENEKHAHKYLNKIPPEAKLTLNTENGIFYDSVTKAADSLNINPTTLLAKLNGQNKNNSKFINA